MRDYYCKRFAETRSLMVDVSERDVIDYFANGLKERYRFMDFIKRKPETSDEFCHMVGRFIDAEERSRERFSFSDGRAHDRTTGRQGGRVRDRRAAVSRE